MVSKHLFVGLACLAVAFAAPQAEEGKSEKRRQYIQPMAGAAQVPRNIAVAPMLRAPAHLMAAPAIPAAPVAPVMAAAPAVPLPPAPVAAVPAAPVAPVMAAPAVPVMQPAVVAPVGQCPGGPSLPIECDPKRPWPQCPPQSYCYATNSVDIGPYFCCPVWSTYGAAWRPATPFYNYVPPMPANWPDVARMTANWPAAAVGLPVKARKPVSNDEEEKEEETKIESSISGWMDRQARL